MAAFILSRRSDTASFRFANDSSWPTAAVARNRRKPTPEQGRLLRLTAYGLNYEFTLGQGRTPARLLHIGRWADFLLRKDNSITRSARSGSDGREIDLELDRLHAKGVLDRLGNGERLLNPAG